MDPSNFDASTVAERAFAARLYRHYAPRLRSALAWRIDPAMQARFDAEDILQETVLRAMQKWSANDGSELPPYGWVYRLALDCLAETCRKEKRSKRNVARDVPIPDRSSLQFAAGLVNASTAPGIRVERSEELARILDVIAGMRSEDREILLMRHLDGLSSVEIADVLGVEPREIHNRYAKAMMRLRKLSQGSRHTPPDQA